MATMTIMKAACAAARKALLTEWFPPHVKPMHVGLYDVDLSGDGAYRGASYWDGRRWCYAHDWDSSGVGDRSPAPDGMQPRYWRGLATEPKSLLFAKSDQSC
jgi:hypothetical protein